MQSNSQEKNKQAPNLYGDFMIKVTWKSVFTTSETEVRSKSKHICKAQLRFYTSVYNLILVFNLGKATPQLRGKNYADTTDGREKWVMITGV